MIHKIKTQVFLKIFSVFLFVLLLGAYASTFALFDGNPYAPGSTLDPECAPTDTNCKVLLTSSAPSQWLDSSNGIYYTNGNVGIGTNTSNAALTVKGSVTTTGPEFISNGNFDTDATGWNLYDTGSYDNGKLTVNYTGIEDWADVSTEFEVESGKTYLVSFTLSGVANDEVYYYFDNIRTDSYPTFTDGNNSSVFISDYTGTETIYFELWNWNDNSTFSIDNISIKEISGGVNPSLEVYNYDNKKLLSIGGNNLNNFFVGDSAGSGATFAANSNFLGVQAGYNATSASYSNFLGNGAGAGATSASSSNFIGGSAGANATSAHGSNFIGQNTGAGATSASGSNFIGNHAGYGATSANNSNFLGTGAGYNATSANNSNFLGTGAGSGATSAHNSNFLGVSAGSGAISAHNSNFLGGSAGYNASSAYGSNFIGSSAGNNATSASYSNFIGNGAGNNATSASYSNFLGNGAGAGATYASNSSFLGLNAGASAINASNSVFIGQNAGAGDAVNNTGNSENFSILIGKSTRTGGFSNSIAIGGSATNTASNQLSFGSSNRPINKLYIAGLNYDLPTSHGSAGNVLTNNGSGVLTWSSASGGSGGLSSDSDYNTKGGTSAGANLISGAMNNTFLGYEAGLSSATLSTNNADYNTAIGYRALYSNTTGFENTANGSNSLYSNTTGNQNTANGYQSLFFNTTGFFNTANGSNSLYSNTTGNQNTANGYQSLFFNTTGYSNTANGSNSLYSNTTGCDNTANGVNSLYSNTTGCENTANGFFSLHFNTTGNQNTANGSGSLLFNTTGSRNTANGYYSLSSNTTGFLNTANGVNSLYSNTTGNSNTANGYQSLRLNTTGSGNTTNGVNSLYSNTTGFENTANGSNSLYSNTTGNQNTANGYQSLFFNTTGFFNTANGSNSLYSNTTGSQNTANGDQSLYYSGRALTPGSFLTGVSYTIKATGTTDFTICGAANSTPGTVFTHNGTPCSGTGTASSNSNNNVAEGYQSGMYIANGSTALTASLNSLFLGVNTKALIDGSQNEIVIGYNTTGHGSNTATWGSTAITNHYFSGNVQYTSYGAGTLTTDANGNITASSDERLKNIIGYYDNKIDNTDSDTNNTETDEDTNNTDDTNTNNDIDSVITEKQKSALERIMEINPIIYKWNEKSGLETEHEYVGFSAQNLQLAIPEAVGLDKRVDPETGESYLTISDRPILATVVNAIKEMDLKVKSFEDFEAEENTLRDNLGAWLANATNKITRIFTGEICLTDGSEEGPVCLNASELRELKESLGTQADSDSDESNDNQKTPTETCSDGIMNQDETGIDEGGVCVEHEVAPTCTDGILNQDETEVDTGGICTPPADPTCSDGIMNQDETGIDEGGVCTPA